MTGIFLTCHMKEMNPQIKTQSKEKANFHFLRHYNEKKEENRCN